MGVILIILKILGIVLLSIISIIILITATILIMPIKYGASFEKYQNINANGFIRWFFGLLKIDVIYSDDNIGYEVKIFGKTIIKEPEEETSKTETDKNTEKEKPKVKEVVFESSEEKEPAKEAVKEPVKEPKEPIKEPLKEPVFKREATIPQIKKEDKFEKIYSQVEEKKATTQKAVVRRVKIKEKEIPPETENRQEKEAEIKEAEKIDKDYFLKMSLSEKKELISVTFDFIKRILKGVKPDDLNISLKVGTDDPALTGYILAAGGFIKGTVFSGLNIAADFDKEILEGEGNLKGTITIGYLLIESLKFAFKKPIWKIIKIYLKGRGVKK